MTDFGTNAAPPRGGMRLKHILLLAVIAFGGGIGASWWLADSRGWLGSDTPVASAAPALTKVGPLPAAATESLIAPLTAAAADRSVNASNAARAEGLLVAIAARRAIDNGTPLGYLADQLRLRFGSSQPQAVITVLQASQAPVTVAALQSELTGIENLLVTGTREETLWATVQREFSELFVLRKSDSPSPAPTQRMLRAHAFVESGNIAGAIAEISAMPGAGTPAVRNWLGRARSYEQTRKALDTLERGALAAPPIMEAPPAPAEMPPAPEAQQIIIQE